MSSSKKSILPIDPVDIHSITPRSEEMVTEEVIGYLNNININTDLLSENDPLRDEYTKFLNDMGNSPIIITNEDIGIDDNKSYFDDIDFSSNNEKPETYGLNIGRDYFIHNNLWANGLFGSTIFPVCSQYVEPVQLGAKVEVRKIAGEKMEFVKVQCSYEPQELLNIKYLITNKK